MPVRASPSTRPAQSVPGRAGQLSSSPLRFLLAAFGFGGTRECLAFTPFLSSGKVPGILLAPVRSWGSTTGNGGLVSRRVPLFPSAPLPLSWGSGRLLGLLFLGHRPENSSWFRTAVKSNPVTSTMSGRVEGGGGDGGGTKGGGSSVSRQTNPGFTSPREGAESGGEASSGDFPVVTLDEDAVQKFAEIEVRWMDAGGDKSSEPTILIRGLESAEYHVEAAEPTMQRLREAGVEATITGGGRIKHSSERRSVFIYG